MKILIFGAAFDPPHIGHMTMAAQAVKKGLADRVVLVPCGDHAFDKVMSSASCRYAMVEVIVKALTKTYGPFFELSDVEIKRKGKSYAWDTLWDFTKKYPDAEIGWLMGSDQLPSFHKWYKYEDILANYPVYVYPRKRFVFEPWYQEMRKITGVPTVEINSSEVRGAYQQDKPIISMVLQEVAKYIVENKLWTK